MLSSMKLSSIFRKSTIQPTSSGPKPGDKDALAGHGYKIVEKIHDGGQGSVVKAVRDTSSMQNQSSGNSTSRNSNEYSNHHTAINGRRSVSDGKEETLSGSGKSSSVVAIKIVSATSEASVNGCMTEYQILKSLEHESILQVKESFRDRSHAYFVFEYLQGGDLYEQLRTRKFSELDVIHIAIQLFNALEYIHAKGIAHRDVKPENLVFCHSWKQDQRVPPLKLIDFGLAVPCQNSIETIQSDPDSGTIYYISPEIFIHDAYNPFKADVWSAGIMVYALLTRRYPWEHESLLGTRDRIINTPLDMSPFEVVDDIGSLASADMSNTAKVRISIPMEKLMQTLLEKDPQKRPTAKCVAILLKKLLASHLRHAMAPASEPASLVEVDDLNIEPSEEALVQQSNLRFAAQSQINLSDFSRSDFTKPNTNQEGQEFHDLIDFEEDSSAVADAMTGEKKEWSFANFGRRKSKGRPIVGKIRASDAANGETSASGRLTGLHRLSLGSRNELRRPERGYYAKF